MVLVDINYSYLNHIIDSGPKFCVARKGRTASEVKGGLVEQDIQLLQGVRPNEPGFV